MDLPGFYSEGYTITVTVLDGYGQLYYDNNLIEAIYSDNKINRDIEKLVADWFDDWSWGKISFDVDKGIYYRKIVVDNAN